MISDVSHWVNRVTNSSQVKQLQTKYVRDQSNATLSRENKTPPDVPATGDLLHASHSLAGIQEEAMQYLQSILFIETQP